MTVDEVKVNVAYRPHLEITLSPSTVAGVDHRRRRGAADPDHAERSAPWSARRSSRTCRSTAASSPTSRVARAGHHALGYNSDPTKPGQLTIALNGGSGRNVNYLVDGGDNTDDTIGGALQNFNLEAVQEFKIQTQQYKAEYGRTTGGVLTVVTKTGTNHFAGQRATASSATRA